MTRNEMLKCADVAQRLGVSPNFVRREILAGRLTAHFIEDDFAAGLLTADRSARRGKFRISRRSLAAYIARGRRTSDARLGPRMFPGIYETRPLEPAAFFSPGDAARVLEVSAQVIRNKIAAGYLAAHRFGKKTIRISRRDLAAFEVYFRWCESEKAKVRAAGPSHFSWRELLATSDAAHERSAPLAFPQTARR